VKLVHPKPIDLLPLSHAQFHILLVLTKGKNHGYGIMKEIEAETRGRFKLGPATLYRSIKRMLDVNLIEETDEQPDPEINDERRRYYRLLKFGRRVVTAEAQRLDELVKIARVRHLIGKSASIETSGKDA
jgi:DNA-binding PadR family transcriptional regulator